MNQPPDLDEDGEVLPPVAELPDDWEGDAMNVEEFLDVFRRMVWADPKPGYSDVRRMEPAGVGVIIYYGRDRNLSAEKTIT